jgi:hypothetical protein
MTPTLKIIVAVALSLVTAFAYADPPGRAGRLNYVHGTVSLAPGQAPDAWAVAVLNRPLTSGDRLWTDRDGYAEFHVGSTAVRLAPRTNVDVLALDDDTLQLRLAQGDVNLRVRDVSDDDIEINTPNGAILLEQAGSYRISTDPSGDATNVIVHYGRAHVLAPYGDLALQAGQHVTLRGPDGIPSEIVSARRDAFDNWSAELDRREDQIASTRYVSPRMTGYEDLDAHGAWRSMPEYGAVWVPRVSAGWAPYRHGHWVWVEPWGWTWIDDAPWGFAPFHYGRWVWLNGHWAWAPGPRIVRPVYAPALVAFVGGSNWSVSIGSGPSVGWIPLGWREPYFPWYRTSPTYVRNVNVTHVQNINVYNNVTRINYVNQSVPQAVTVVPREAFVSARPVTRHAVQVQPAEIARAPVTRSIPAAPVESSFAARRADTRPPEALARREVVATRTPRERPVLQSATAPDSTAIQRDAQRTAPEPRVRVIERQRAADDGAPRRRAQGGSPTEVSPRGATPDTKGRPQVESRPQPEAKPARPAEQQRQDVERGSRAEERAERRGPEPARESTARQDRSASPAKSTPSAPPGQADRAQRDNNRDATAPAARPQPAPERPSRAEPERRPEREQQIERRTERDRPQADRAPTRSEPQNRAPGRSEGPPRAEREPAPRAEPRQQRPEPRSESRPQPQPRAEPRAQAPQPAPRAQAPQPAPRAESPRPAPQAGGAQQQQRAQAQRPEARGPQNGGPPRGNGGRDNRDRGKD